MVYLVFKVSTPDEVTLMRSHDGVVVEEVARGDVFEVIRGVVNDAERSEDPTPVVPAGERLAYEMYADYGGVVPEED